MPQDSYLLRIWRPAQGTEWRITLIPVAPGATEQHFVSVEALTRHLCDAYQTSDAFTNSVTTVDEIKRLRD